MNYNQGVNKRVMKETVRNWTVGVTFYAPVLYLGNRFC